MHGAVTPFLPTRGKRTHARTHTPVYSQAAALQTHVPSAAVQDECHRPAVVTGGRGSSNRERLVSLLQPYILNSDFHETTIRDCKNHIRRSFDDGTKMCKQCPRMIPQIIGELVDEREAQAGTSEKTRRTEVMRVL